MWDILELLGYGEPNERTTIIFLQDVSSFLHALRQVDGSCGAGHMQADATVNSFFDLTNIFLEQHARGQLYWPASAGPSHLSFHLHRDTIFHQMVQLFSIIDEKICSWRRLLLHTFDPEQESWGKLSFDHDAVQTFEHVQKGLVNTRQLRGIIVMYSVVEERQGIPSTVALNGAFLALTWAQLRDRLPLRHPVAALKVTFSGTGFCISKTISSEESFSQLRHIFNQQFERFILLRHFPPMENVTVQVQFTPVATKHNGWLFSLQD